MHVTQLPASLPALIRRYLDAQGWERVLLYSFHVVCEQGSYYKAAPLLDLQGVTSVRKRVEALQRILDVALVVPELSGHNLTAVGSALRDLIRHEFA